MAIAYLGLGSNLGDRLGYLKKALEGLAADRVAVDALSGVYETEPWGVTDQPRYLNAVAKVKVPHTAQELLRTCLSVERELGRERREKWGPRVIDIDILLYEDMQLSSRELMLPHPHLAQRRFVLEPLVEIAPDLHLPDGRAIRALLNLPDVRAQHVLLWADGVLSIPSIR